MVFPRTSPLLPRVVLAACFYLVIVSAIPRANAQDKVFRPGNPTPQEGKITGVEGDAIMLTVPNGKTSVPLGVGVRVEAAAPPTYATGIAAYNAGNYDKALTDLKPIGDAFRGLPTDWARLTIGALGNIYLEKNDVAKAEAAFNDYRKYYSAGAGSNVALSVAQARLAFAKNNAPQARQQLEPITQTALKAPAKVTRADGAAYGQAFYLMAKLQERDSNFQGALENYLRVVTLFYQDAAVAGRAQKSADDLRTKHKDISAP